MSTSKKLAAGKKKTVRKSTPRPKKQKNIFMRFIALVTGLMVVLAITFFITLPNSNTVRIASVNDLGTFSGVLPCADCPGIETTISFKFSDDSKSSHTYTETDVYQERNVTNTTTGTWQYVSNPRMPKDIIIELIPKGGMGKSYFQVVNATTLQMLDADMNPVPLQNTTLTKE